MYIDKEDIELIMLCREHNDEAFGELVRRYSPMIRRAVKNFNGSIYTDGELFAEGCVALHSAANTYTCQEGLTFGLYARICVNHRIIDLIRRSNKLRQITECDVELVAVEADVGERMVKREAFNHLLDRARSVLSEYEYSVLVLHIQGYKTAYIAKELGKTPKSVDNAKNRLFRRLRSEFSDVSDN